MDPNAHASGGDPAGGAPGWTPRGLAPVAAVAALGVAAYANTFAVPFQYDDGHAIVGNAAVRDLGAFLASAPAPARVVAYLTFALNGSLHGQSVWGYHALNLAIHVAAALCVYALALLAGRAAAAPGSWLERRARAAALVAAALFVAHPLQTQAVTYVVQRMASLAALLYLGAVLAYARAAREPGRGRAGAYAGALALAALAIFTKENAATLPAALVLVEACFLDGPPRRRAARLAPFAALVVGAILALRPAATASSTGAQLAAAARLAGDSAAASVPPWRAYAATQPSVILEYLRLVVLPVGQSVEHDPPLSASLLEPRALASAALLALLLGGGALIAWRARRRTPVARIALFGIGWVVVTLSVESSVIPLADVMVEHRMYLPVAGVFVAVGWGVAAGLERVGPGARRLAAAAVAACVLLLAGATHARNAVWRDAETLWADAARKAPERSRPRVYLGSALLARGETARAIATLEEATRLRPRHGTAFLNLGRAYAQAGRPGDAERALREGLGAPGGRKRWAHFELGRVLLTQGRIDEACAEFREETAVDPTSRDARLNLVVCALSRGDAAAAVAQAERLDAEAPGDPNVLFNLGVAAATLGDAPRAADAYRRFLARAGPALEPQRASAARWLAEHAR